MYSKTNKDKKKEKCQQMLQDINMHRQTNKRMPNRDEDINFIRMHKNDS